MRFIDRAKNNSKNSNQFESIYSRHVVAVCTVAALLASTLVIQGQKKAMNQPTNDHKIEVISSVDVRKV